MVTADFQEVSIQGQLTYRVTNAAVGEPAGLQRPPQRRFVSEDPDKLDERWSTSQVLAAL
jgi:hypothetical protein